jgi:NadR type nicotinamide-nucleotide adenylyltransferase
MPFWRTMYSANRPKVKRIAIVGPECSGKTALAQALARHYHTAWVPEFARDYLNTLGRPYTQHDLLIIARGQVQWEEAYSQQATRLLICDTNLLVIKIWSEFKYGSCHPEIIRLMEAQHYDLHLLTHPDVPWEDDPQREHPDKRNLLFSIYRKEIEAQQVPFAEISGMGTQRTEKAIRAIDFLLLNKD